MLWVCVVNSHPPTIWSHISITFQVLKSLHCVVEGIDELWEVALSKQLSVSQFLQYLWSCHVSNLTCRSLCYFQSRTDLKVSSRMCATSHHLLLHSRQHCTCVRLVAVCLCQPCKQFHHLHLGMCQRFDLQLASQILSCFACIS